MKILIIIPTYNEKDTIENIITKIFSINKNYHILVVDDSSPDGTSLIVEDLKEKCKNIFLIKRPMKSGLGTAYCSAFKWAINNNYEKVVQIDADLSHNPKDIPILIKESDLYDLVIGSGYITGINVVNWPLSRLFLSYFANIYAKIITGLPLYDSTAGFKRFNIYVLKTINLDKIKSNGYSFQIEMNFITWINNYSLKEIPIIFYDRRVGTSKMSRKIIFEAVYMVPILRIKKFFGLVN